MMPLRTLTVASLIAFGSATFPNLPLAHPAEEGSVLSLAIAPSSGRTEVVIGIAGDVSVSDFTLAAPDRIVVDIANATVNLPVGSSYDRIARGAITNVRYSQFKSDVVRVVINLSEKRGYKVSRVDGGVRVMLDDAAPAFEVWRVGRAVSAEPVPAPSDVVASVKPEAEGKMVTAAGALVAPPAPIVRTISSAQQTQQRRITITFPENTPIRTIITEFANFAGVTIVPSKSVTGNYGPIQIENQPWDVALRAILNANGYDAYQDPITGIIHVDTYQSINSRATSAPMITRRVELNYAKANTVAEMVKTQLSRDCQTTTTTTSATIPAPQPTSPTVQGAAVQPAAPATASQTVESINCPVRGTAIPDTLTNAVQIIDIPSNMDILEAFAKSLDIKPRQVNVKAKILSVDRSSLEGLGIRYDLGTATQFFTDLIPRVDSTGAAVTAGQIALGGNALSAIANAATRVPGAAVQLVYSTAIGGFDFSTFIEALSSSNVLDVMAEPQVTVSNNTTANLTAGTQVPVRVVDAGSLAGGGQGAVRAQVQTQQVGIILTVTPQITNNRQVKMKLHVENSSVQFVATDVQAVFPKEFVDTDVLVADGETVVISGLTQTEVRQTRSGIPFLVDLPIIGKLFGVTQRQETKRDLLIMITPTITDDGTPVRR